jgi:hypothetical protein
MSFLTSIHIFECYSIVINIEDEAHDMVTRLSYAVTVKSHNSKHKHGTFPFSSQAACGGFLGVRVRAATASRPSPSHSDEARRAEEAAFPGKLKNPVRKKM